MPSTALPSTPPRVLVAEDDDAMRSLIAEALADEGFDVVEASDGEHALPWLVYDVVNDRTEFDVDAIVTDLRMPEMDGLDLLDLARAGSRPVPVIIVSAFADTQLRQQATARGATAVLAKPFVLADLVAAVRTGLSATASGRRT